MSEREGSILVLGAGELGEAVLFSLLPRAASKGVGIDLLVRNPSSPGAEKASALGAELVQGDVATASENELAELFRGYDTVLSCVGFAAGPGTQLKLTRAVLAAGIRRYFPWQFGVDYDLVGRGGAQPVFDEQFDVRALLRAQSRTHWVIVSVGMFTSFLFEPSFGVVDISSGVVHALGSWTNAVTVTTPEDIGKLTTEIVFTEPELTDEVVYLAGDTVTYGELADIVEKALGRSIERKVWDLPKLQADLADMPDDALRRYRAVFAGGRGMSWNKASTFNALRSIPVTDTATWLEAHLETQ